MKIALRATNGQYLRAVNGGDFMGAVFADRTVVGPDETWTLVTVAGGVALQSRTGRYLSAEGGGGSTVHANRTAVGPWETWTETEGGGFLANSGRHYLCAELGTNTFPVNATRTSRGPWETWTIESQETALDGLAVNGRAFVLNGQRWTWMGITNFLLFQRYLEGQEIADVLYDGFDVYRVTSLMAFIPSVIGLRALAPATYPHYWDGLGAFADHLAGYGKRIELTVFADAQVVMPSLGAQRDHLAHVVDVLRDKTNVTLEIVNEYPKNGVDPRQLTYEGRTLLTARGSSTSDDPPAVPLLDYSTFHPRRDGKWRVTIPQTIYELRTGWGDGNGISGFKGLGETPIVLNELMGAGEVDVLNKRSTDVDGFFRYGVDCGLWAAGATFHAEDAVFSRPLGPTQQQCAEAFRRGLTVGGAR